MRLGGTNKIPREDPWRVFGLQGLPPAQRGKEEIPVGLGAARTADPDWQPSVEIADDDAVVVPLPDGHLVHAARP